ncbi:MAG: amylo-alpha-1,6-glucosidase [Actinobacteria bacterium]|nr:amylo-alpha-1,6-glucosidase [Actinomycetota bacterium]
MSDLSLELGPQDWETFDAGVNREWLETNGLGGYAFGTVIGANARLYQGLLIAALNPPVERVFLLAKLEEQVDLEGRVYRLYSNRWASGHTEMDGARWLREFRPAPFPTFTYGFEDVLITKKVFMPHGQNTTVIRYSFRTGGRRLGLKLTPLVNCRPIHQTTRRCPWPFSQESAAPGHVRIRAYPGARELHLAADRADFYPGGCWYLDMRYDHEMARGLDHVEDHYAPGHFWTTVGDGDELTLVASAGAAPFDRVSPAEGAAMEEAEIRRRAELVARAEHRDPFARALVRAADQFIVRRASTGAATVIAGYPWFTDWGRDTMIALPGLTLVTRRFDVAREVLLTFARYCRDGLIPNVFPDEGTEPLYNTADASLWFFWAVQKYLRYTRDFAFIEREIFPVLEGIVDQHLRGTGFGIRVGEDGLIEAGGPGLQLTWMDAKVDDWVVTPRCGKPVEINARWYNALRLMAGLAARFGKEDRYSAAAGKVRESFNREFWNPGAGCLYDVAGEAPDPSIRPNQIIAISLPHSVLDREREKAVVDRAWRDLYTPHGLRSLAPQDPRYRGTYRGNRVERDAAYHQGTVWGWLAGPFVTAFCKVYGHTASARQIARTFLSPFRAHLRHAGLGSISEIFDGDAPHTPRGCVAQAWSVAEVLRAYVEEGLAEEEG